MATKANPDGSSEYASCFAAQYPIFGDEGMGALRNTTLLIVGAGGLGTPVAVCAARSGFEHIIHVDPQRIEPDNLNRIWANTRQVGQSKVSAVEDVLSSFDRLQRDPDFTYTPLPLPVEDERMLPYLAQADCIVSCPNSTSARLFLARYAVANRTFLLNVGVACQPGKFMNGEVFIYRPDRPDLACPGCVALSHPDQPEKPSDPLFHPPLGIVASLAVHLLAAEITNFDNLGASRPNYFLHDGFEHSVSAFTIAADPDCDVCGREKSQERGRER